MQLFIFPFIWGAEIEAGSLAILLFIIPFLIFTALFIFLTLSAFRASKVRWGFGIFPPGFLFWKGRSIEEELSELRSYERWLELELERVRREIERRERENLFRR